MPVSDNTAASTMTATAGDLRMFAVNSLLLGVIAKLDGDEAATLREMADRVKATADALYALRAVNPGCGCEFATTQCGKPLHEGTPHRLFCDQCNTKREAAIAALLGEGGSNGR